MTSDSITNELPAKPPNTDLSVILIVAAQTDTPDLVVDALQNQSTKIAFELIIVDGRVYPAPAEFETSGLTITYIAAPEDNMPVLKAIGVQAATASITAFLEPSGIPDENWIQSIVRGFEDMTVDALGGVVLAKDNPNHASAAAFLFEYSTFTAASIRSGKTHDLPGNNMAFRREVLLQHCADILNRDGLNKPFCQQRLESAGLKIKLADTMIIEMSKQHSWRKLLRSRFSYARCFGGTRLHYASRLRRVLYRLASPVIPIIVVTKQVSATLSFPASFRTRLMFIALCITWSAGEITGYWLGTGTACKNLR